MAGLEDIAIGDTIADPAHPVALPRIEVEEPTIAVYAYVNDSPFARREGKLVTSREIRERLVREAYANVSFRVEETGSPDTFKVLGRGELQLGILIETRRREGYEMAVGKPEVITRHEDGRLQEPREQVVVDVSEEFLGAVTRRSPAASAAGATSTAAGRAGCWRSTHPLARAHRLPFFVPHADARHGPPLGDLRRLR